MMKGFISRCFFCFYYFLFWICYFVFSRVFFLSYYFEKTQNLGFYTTIKTFLYGLQLDISFAAYLCVFPFLLVLISSLLISNNIFKILRWYTFLLLIIINLLLLIDAGLYQAWGIRVDSSLLPYLNTPELMIATVSNLHLFLGIGAWIILTFFFFKIYTKFIHQKTTEIRFVNWLLAPVFLLITATLIIPIRGGFQTIPVNQSNVYFSSKMFANHAATNFIWNFFNTITHKTDGKNPYKYFDEKTAKKIINKTKKNLLKANTDSILNVEKPNVVLILWESLSAKVVGSLGGETGVTPNLNRLSKEGVLFTNFYGNGDRTDKAIPAILSGYYPQPLKRIMRMPNKTRSLPMLPKKMEVMGYKTSFYYGGDLNFGNMNTYLRNAGINEIVDGNAFDKKDWNSKWGAYDDVFMKRFAKDLAKKQSEPFFKIALTLSSHEPYEIKGNYKFGSDNEDNNYRSAHVYTDKVIGEFIENAKKQDWYKNTLIVIMGDHGHSSPKHKGPYFSPKKFKTPMLWLGGALYKKGIKIDHFSSQVDFSYTLLSLLGGETKDFIFGKHIFNSSDKQYAHYVFNKGYGTLNKNGVFVYDYIGKKPILKTGKKSEILDSLGKAITQDSYEDFLNRK